MPDNLVALIKAKREQIAKLQAELDEARAALAGEPAPTKLAALIASAQHSEATARSHRPSRSRERPRRVGTKFAPGELAPGSTTYWADRAIRSAGRPLHVREIIKAAEQEGHKMKQLSLVGSLSRWVKRGMRFYRAGRNTFGLIEMRKG